MDKGLNFLRAVLGGDGATALLKSVEKAPELACVLVPRAVVAWLEVLGPDDIDSALPGVEGSLAVVKSEAGYSGSLVFGADSVEFKNATPLRIAATLSLALGSTPGIPEQLRDIDLRNLGKSLDTLVKARAAIEELKLRKASRGEAIIRSHTDAAAHVASLPEEQRIALAKQHGLHPGLYEEDVHSMPQKPSYVEWRNDRLASKLAPKFYKADVRPNKGGAEAPGPHAAPRAATEPVAPIGAEPKQDSKGPETRLKPPAIQAPKQTTSTEVVQTSTQPTQPKAKAPGEEKR